MKKRTRNYLIGAAVAVALLYAFSKTETGEAAIEWLPWKHADPKGISGYTPPEQEEYTGDGTGITDVKLN